MATRKRFTRAYVKYFEREHSVSLGSARDWDALDSTLRMWFDYALLTNKRGDDLVDLLERAMPMKGRRYLDIGSGFGGCLVAAARRGAACVGIDIDPVRIALARENIADFGLTAPVLDQDSLDLDLPARLGRFDFISANDVVEHVERPQDLFRNVGAMLNPGGVACLEIPNRFSTGFVAADGHFGLFGITLLDRDRAREYHAQFFPQAYDVGDYAPLDVYLDLFERNGLRARLIETLYHPTRPFSDLDGQLHLLDQAPKNEHAAAAYADYRAQLDRDRVALTEDAFRAKYLRNFWTFVATPQQAVGGGEQGILDRFGAGG